MCAVTEFNTSKVNIYDFTYPKLHAGKNWYVDFFAFDPVKGTMKRKKVMLDGIAKIGERRKRAAEIIERLMSMLRNGWNPWINTESSRQYTLFSDVLERYIEYVEKMTKYKTRKSYTSRVNILKEYLAQMAIPIKYVYQFDSAFVSDFLDWIYIDRKSSARTRNNYRGWCSSLAQFCIEKKYISSNPVESIKQLNEKPKKRQPLSPVQLQKVSTYLRNHDKHFLLACMLEYYTFIRPQELSYLKLSDINIAKQKIYVSGEYSKNKRDENVGVNEEIIKLMLELEIFNYPNDYYIFGKGLLPSDTRVQPDIFTHHWNKMRDELGFSDEYQFYSLKDSGIRDLANAEGIVIARDQARHTDVSTTNKYLQGKDKSVHTETMKFVGNL